MPDTTVSTAQDLVQHLTDQHEQVKTLMPKVLDATGDEREQTFAQVRRMLAVHEALEQATVHVLARSQASPDEAHAREQEETEAESAITELERTDTASNDFTDKYQALSKDVVAHAESEEHEEFNQLTGDLTDQAKAKVALAEQLQTGQGLEGDSFADMFASAQHQLRQLD